MLKKFLIVGATGALMASTALAQTPSSPSADSPPSASSTPAPSTSTPTPSASSTSASPKFVSSQSADQWATSKFKGTDVVGSDNAKIGDVSDVVFDKSGKIVAVVVGVGGFLGIGAKDVALDMTAFEMVPADSVTASGSGSTPPTAPAATPDPNDVKLKVALTKDQLKEAPAFEYYKAPARTAGSAGGAGGAANTGAAPRPATPSR